MVYEINPIVRGISRVIGILIFLFAMWFLSRYLSKKPKKEEKGKTDVINVGAWLIGLGGIFLGLIFLFFVIIAVAFTPELTPLRILLAVIGLGVGLLFLWSGYAFTSMAKGTWKKGTWKRPEISPKVKQSLHITDEHIDRIKQKNAQLSWWLMIFIIVGSLITTSITKPLCSTKDCILFLALFEISFSIGVLFFIFAWFCKKYRAIGFLGNIHLLTEQKTRFWNIFYTILGIIAILIGISITLFNLF